MAKKGTSNKNRGPKNGGRGAQSILSGVKKPAPISIKKP